MERFRFQVMMRSTVIPSYRSPDQVRGWPGIQQLRVCAAWRVFRDQGLDRAGFRLKAGM